MSVINPPKRLLFGAGPTQVPERVYRAMSRHIVGHLDPYFFQIVEEIRAQLRPLFGTASPFVHVLSGTGSLGMEASLANFVIPGQKLAVFSAGYFAERLIEQGRRHGANVVILSKPWGEWFTAEEASEFIHREKPDAVAFVHAETSTGVLTDPKIITKPAHEVGAIVIADCVTSLGCIPINMDENGIDVAYSCSQKGLSCPPGLSPVAVSAAAMDRLKSRKDKVPIWYVDLTLLMDYFEGPRRYHHTAPITNFYALREGLEVVAEEGVEARFARHRAAHEMLVKRAELIKLEMFVKDPARRIPNLNVIKWPEGTDDAKTRKRLLEEHHIEVSAGLGPLAGKIVRVGLFGAYANEEIATMIIGTLIHCMRD
jgi:alanine-glyoxylate transaminase/serine-glyoxylate transaminase/serine-pyruvate transaminase